MSGELRLSPLDRVAQPPIEAEILPPLTKPARTVPAWTVPAWRTMARLGWRGLTVTPPPAAVPLQDGGLQLGPQDRVMPAGEAAAAASRPERIKRTWREERWERRRRRRVGEEILGWILVPIILASLYWATKAGLAAFGTTPTALVQGVKAALGGRI